MQRAIWWAALIAFTVVCVGVWGFLATWDRSATLERARERVQTTAQLLEQHAGRALVAADTVIRDLVRSAGDASLGDPQLARTIHEQAVQLITGAPVASAWVMDERGRVVADSWSHPPRSSGSFAERAYFRAHAEGERALFFGPVQVGSLSGQPRFTLSRPILHSDGRFGGVAVAGILSEYFAGIYREAGLGDGSRLQLTTADGGPLAEWPIGRSGPSADQADVITAERRLPMFPAMIRVTQPVSTALAEWRERTTASALIALGMIVAFAGLTGLGLRTAWKEERARTELRDANEHLEARVRERTAALADSRTEIATILDIIPVGVGVVDPSGRFVRSNPELRRYVGTHLPSSPLAGPARWVSLGPGGRPLAPPEFPGARALRGETVSKGQDFLRVAPDGAETWLRVSAVPMQDGGGAVVVIQDIDQLKRAESDLAARHDELQALYDSAPIGLGMLGTDMRFVRVNRRLAALGGRPPEDLVGRTLGEVAPDIGTDADTLVGEVIESRQAVIGRELVGRAAEADVRRSWNVSLNPIVDEAGEVAAVNLVLEETTERKRIAEALARSEAQLRLATAGAGVGTWEVDLAAGRGHWSPIAAEILGLERQDFTGTDWMECVHPDDRSAAIEAWRQALRQGHYETRVRVRRPEAGCPRWVHARGRIEFDGEGRPVRGAGVVMDITEQAEAEAALTAGENRLRLIADAVPALVSFVGPDQRYRFVNRSYEEWFGLERDTVQGRSMQEILGEDAYTALRPHVEAALSGRRVRFETEARYARGPARRIEAEYIPNVTPDGRRDGFFVFVTDVTQRKADETALRESREHLRLALAAGQLGDWTWDAESDALSFSRRACEIFGVPAETALTWRELRRLLDPDDGRRAMRAMDDAIASRTDYSIEYRVNRPDGRRAWVAAQGRPTYLADGRPLGMAGIVRDVTDRHEAEEHLKMLINELNHRVKNTLATVQSIAAQSLKSARNGTEAREAIESRLIALSRSHDLLTNQGWEGASLRDVAAQALEPFGLPESDRIRIEGRDIWLKPNLSLAFSMAFHELATNAAKYGALSVPQGRLRLGWSIESRRDGDRLRVRWEESGGPPVVPPSRKGFGTRLIERGLSFELGGTVNLSFAPTGVVCEIETASPLPRTEALAYG